MSNNEEPVVVTVTNDPVIVTIGGGSGDVVIKNDPVTIEVNTEPVVIVPGGITGPGGATGPQGPPGAGVVPTTSGQALSAGRLTTITDSGAFYFDPTDTSQYGKAVGITGSAVGIGDAVEVHCAGVVSLVGAGFTPGQRFWAGPNGTLLTTPPSSGLVVPVGYAVDADNLFVQIESYLEW